MTAPTIAKKPLSQKAITSVNVLNRKLTGNTVFGSLIIFSAFLFSATLFLNFLAADPKLSKGLFKNSIANISNQYSLNITPAGWAFSIWGVIYLLQLSWLVYSLSLLCRKTDMGPAFLNPIVLSPAFFIFFNLSSGFNIGWLFMWDRIMFLASFIFLACTAMSLSLSYAIVSVRLFMFRNNLIDQGRKGDVKFITAVVVNGVGMYATWTTIATLINLGVVLVYKLKTPITNENASTICLGILTAIVIVYISLDFTVFKSYTRYAFSPYAVVVWALAAVLAQNYSPDLTSSILSASLLSAVSLALVIKIGVVAYNQNREMYQYRPMNRGRQ